MLCQLCCCHTITAVRAFDRPEVTACLVLLQPTNRLFRSAVLAQCRASAACCRQVGTSGSRSSSVSDCCRLPWSRSPRGRLASVGRRGLRPGSGHLAAIGLRPLRRSLIRSLTERQPRPIEQTAAHVAGRSHSPDPQAPLPLEKTAKEYFSNISVFVSGAQSEEVKIHPGSGLRAKRHTAPCRAQGIYRHSSSSSRVRSDGRWGGGQSIGRADEPISTPLCLKAGSSLY